MQADKNSSKRFCFPFVNKKERNFIIPRGTRKNFHPLFMSHIWDIFCFITGVKNLREYEIPPQFCQRLKATDSHNSLNTMMFSKLHLWQSLMERKAVFGKFTFRKWKVNLKLFVRINSISLSTVASRIQSCEMIFPAEKGYWASAVMRKFCRVEWFACLTFIIAKGWNPEAARWTYGGCSLR